MSATRAAPAMTRATRSKFAALGYEPQMPFEDGLELIVQWFRDDRTWWEPLRRQTGDAATRT